MRQVISLLLGLAVFCASAVIVTLLYQQVHFGYWVGLVFLGLAGWGAGYLAARNARDAFSGMLGGVIATTLLWFVDQHSSAWAATVFHAPLLSLNSDEVLLGMSLTLMAFLVGARMGEQAGLRALHVTLQESGGVQRHSGAPPGGNFGLPAPPPASSPAPARHLLPEPEESVTQDLDYPTEGTN